MFRISIFLVMGLVAAPARATDLALHDCRFGEAYAFASAGCRIRLENPGDQSISVDLSAMEKNDAVVPTTLTVRAHDSAEATVRVAIGNASGVTTRSIKVHRRDGNSRDAYVRASGFVMSALDDPKAVIAFGKVDLPSEEMEKSIQLGSRDTASFRILRVLEKPDSLDVRVGTDGQTITAILRPAAVWGILDGDIKLAIDTPHQKEAWIHVSGDIRGEVVPEKNPYWFGGVPAGHQRTVLVPLTDRQGRDFRIGRIELKNIDAKVDTASCQPAVQGCAAIRLRIADAQRSGITRGTLDVEFPDLRRHLNLRIWGILQPPEADKSQASSVSESADESAPWTPSIIESINAPVYAVPVDDPAEVEAGPAPLTSPLPGMGPLLKWAAADERSAHGYQIFRSDAEAGPFVLLNTKTIPVHPRIYATYPYQWRDTSAQAGHTYWYYIGVVHRDGHKQALSKPQKTVARAPKPEVSGGIE